MKVYNNKAETWTQRNKKKDIAFDDLSLSLSPADRSPWEPILSSPQYESTNRVYYYIPRESISHVHKIQRGMGMYYANYGTREQVDRMHREQQRREETLVSVLPA